MKNKKMLIFILSLVVILFVGFGVKTITSPKYKIKKVANMYMESLKDGVPNTLLISTGIDTKIDDNFIDSYELTKSYYSTDGIKDKGALIGMLTYKIKVDGKTKVVMLVVSDVNFTKFMVQGIVTNSGN